MSLLVAQTAKGREYSRGQALCLTARMLAAFGPKMANKQVVGLSGELDASIATDTSETSDQNGIWGIKKRGLHRGGSLFEEQNGRATRADNQAEAPSPPRF